MSSVNNGVTPPMGGLEALVAAASAANQAGNSKGRGKRKRSVVDADIDPALRVSGRLSLLAFSHLQLDCSSESYLKGMRLWYVEGYSLTAGCKYRYGLCLNVPLH